MHSLLCFFRPRSLLAPFRASQDAMEGQCVHSTCHLKRKSSFSVVLFIGAAQCVVFGVHFDCPYAFRALLAAVYVNWVNPVIVTKSQVLFYSERDCYLLLSILLFVRILGECSLSPCQQIVVSCGFRMPESNISKKNWSLRQLILTCRVHASQYWTWNETVNEILILLIFEYL